MGRGKKDDDLLYLTSAGNIDPFNYMFLNPMASIELEGYFFPCPNHPETFLETRYGKGYMDHTVKKPYSGPEAPAFLRDPRFAVDRDRWAPRADDGEFGEDADGPRPVDFMEKAADREQYARWAQSWGYDEVVFRTD